MQRSLKQQVANLQQNWHRILLTMSLVLTLLCFLTIEGFGEL